MKKKISIAIFVIVFIASFIAPFYKFKAYAEEGVNISITTDKTQYNVGDTVTLSIGSQKEANLYGVQFYLNYDPEALKLTLDNNSDYIIGNYTNYFQDAQEESKGKLSYALINKAGSHDTSKDIGQVKFKALKKGNAAFNFSEIKIVDGNANTIYYKNSYQSSIEIKDVLVSGVKLNKNEVNVASGKTIALTADVLPENATNKTVTWSSSDNNAAVVDSNGIVTGKNPGKSVITVKTLDGNFVDTCEVTVSAPIYPVTGISISEKTASLEIGKTLKLNAVITPDNASNKAVVWSSSDNAIASVDKDGSITAKKAGQVTITAKSEDGELTVSCLVTVKSADQGQTGNTGENGNGSGIDKIPQTGSPIDNTVLILIGMLLINTGIMVLLNNKKLRKEV